MKPTLDEAMRGMSNANCDAMNKMLYGDDKPPALWRRIQHRLERAGEAIIRLVAWLAALTGFACFTIGISVVSAMLIGVKWITAIALLKSLTH